MAVNSVGISIYRAVLVAGISIGGSLLQAEFKQHLGGGAAYVTAVLIAALFFAAIDLFLLELIYRIRLLRRIFVAESKFEGWWLDLFRESSESEGQAPYQGGGTINIYFEGCNLHVEGTSFDIEGRTLGTFNSFGSVSCQSTSLHFEYTFTREGNTRTKNTMAQGYARYNFVRATRSDYTLSGFFFDYASRNTQGITGKRLDDSDVPREAVDRKEAVGRYIDAESPPRQTAGTSQEQAAFVRAVMAFHSGHYANARREVAGIEPRRPLYSYATTYLELCIKENAIRKPFDDPKAFTVFNTYGPETTLKDAIAHRLASQLKTALDAKGNIRLGCIGPGDGSLLDRTLGLLGNDRSRVELVLVEPNERFLSQSQDLLTRAGHSVTSISHAVQSASLKGVLGTLDVVHCVFSMQCVGKHFRGAAFQALRDTGAVLVLVEFDDSMTEGQAIQSAERIENTRERFSSLVDAIVGQCASTPAPSFDPLGITMFLMPVMFGRFANDEPDRSTHEQPIESWRSELSSAGFGNIKMETIPFSAYFNCGVVIASK